MLNFQNPKILKAKYSDLNLIKLKTKKGDQKHVNCLKIKKNHYINPGIKKKISKLVLQII